MNVVSKRTLPEKAEFVIKSIHDLDIRLDSDSRFMKMHRILTTRRDIIPPDDPHYSTARESIRDLILFEFIFEQQSKYRDRKAFRELVRKATKDSSLPQADRTNSKGRDAHTELFIAAICKNAGTFIVEHDEPDITCVYNSTKYGIAVKRIKSITKLERHTRKAAQQIHKIPCHGIIALDITIAANPDNLMVVDQLSDKEYSRFYANYIDKFITNHFRDVHKWIRGCHVRGIVIHHSIVRQDMTSTLHKIQSVAGGNR